MCVTMNKVTMNARHMHSPLRKKRISDILNQGLGLRRSFDQRFGSTCRTEVDMTLTAQKEPQIQRRKLVKYDSAHACDRTSIPSNSSQIPDERIPRSSVWQTS